MLPSIHLPATRLNISKARPARCICRSVATPSQSSSGRAAQPSTTTVNRSGDFASVLGLVQWAVENKVRFTGCRPDIRSGVRGVYTTSDCGAGDNLVAVPLQSSLVVRPGERCPFPDFIPQEVWVGLPWYSQLAAKLLHERSLGPASRFADYLPALPARVDLPVLWPHEHVRRLQYPYLEQQILDEQDEWLRLYDTVRRHLDRRGLSREDLFWALACVRSRTFAGPHLPTPPAVKLAAGAVAAAAVAALRVAFAANDGAAAAAADAAGVAAAVLPAALAALGVPAVWQAAEARRAESGELGTVLYAVCPFIDMFNHDSRAQTECVFAPWKDEFRVAASEPYRRGQQVLINYGSQSNDALLQRYGFVQLEGNPHDRYVLQDMRVRLEAALEGRGAAPREEVRAAASRLNPPAGSLDQVTLTAAGVPQQTLQAVAALLAAVAGSPPQPHAAPSAGGARPLSPEAAVAAACREEAAAAATSLQEDEMALAQLGRWRAWEAGAEERQAAAAAAAVNSVDVVSAATTEEARHEVDGSGNLADVEASLGAGAEEASGEQRGEVAPSGSLVELHPLPLAGDDSVLAPLELAAFEGDEERYRTVLSFRIAKKRVLRTLAA